MGIIVLSHRTLYYQINNGYFEFLVILHRISVNIRCSDFTSGDMEFIEHPTLIDQKHDFESVLSKISTENVDKVLAPFRLCCVTVERMITSGRTNIIYLIKTKPVLQSNQSSATELILKVSNPHRFWAQYRTKNEVFAMQYIHENTTIPLPKVIDYSYDAKASLLQCEYILMEKIHGNTLESIIRQIDHSALMKIREAMIGYVKQMRQLQMPEMRKIGSFRSKDMALGGCVQDGPNLGPFHTIQQFIIGHLEFSVQRIQTDQQLLEFGQHLLSPLQTVIERARIDEFLCNAKNTFYMTHTDLNSSNIVVNETTGKILAILDWERSTITFEENDIKFYERWCDDDQRQKKIRQWIHTDTPSQFGVSHISSDMDKINPYLDVMYAIMYATFYSCTWYDSEHMVMRHIKRFLGIVENATAVFNNTYYNRQQTKEVAET